MSPNNLLHLTQRSALLFVHSLRPFVAQKSATTAAQMSKALWGGAVRSMQYEEMNRLIFTAILLVWVSGCSESTQPKTQEMEIEARNTVLDYLAKNDYLS